MENETKNEKYIRLLCHNKIRYRDYNPRYKDVKNNIIWFKKHRGKSFKKVYKNDKSYLFWIVNDPRMLATHYKVCKDIYTFLKYKKDKQLKNKVAVTN